MPIPPLTCAQKAGDEALDGRSGVGFASPAGLEHLTPDACLNGSAFNAETTGARFSGSVSTATGRREIAAGPPLNGPPTR